VESGTGAFDGFDPDASAVALDNSPANREADAGPWNFAAMEALKRKKNQVVVSQVRRA
jgi:hypothetical protein